MSREVLLKVSSSAIEFADATTTQTSPMASDGSAAFEKARQPESGASPAVAAGARATVGARSSAVEGMFRAMAHSRLRSLGSAGDPHGQEDCPRKTCEG